MLVSIIIPIYNEKDTVLDIIDIVKKVDLPDNLKREIILVDDGSKDGTVEILHELDEDPSVHILFHQSNQGKGAAVRKGFQNAKGDILIIQDADLEYNPHEYSSLLDPILKGKADVVYGSRFMGSNPHRVLYFWHTVANKFLTFCSNAFSDLNMTDIETCYKVFRKEALDRITIEENRFGFEPEITAKLGKKAREEGLRIYEVGISYYGRTYEDGKKIKSKDAFWALWCIFKYNTSITAHIVKYFIFGLLIALSQYFSIFVLVELSNFDTIKLERIANIISIFISFTIAFIIHSRITWRYHFRSKFDVIKKILLFYAVSSFSLIFRILAFNFFQNLGIGYLLNTTIGIGIAILLNFTGYNKIVFSEKSDK